MATDAIGISVLIHTKNEQHDLPGCLASLVGFDDIHVFDSGSTDKTLEIAIERGAHVTVRDYGDSTLSFGGNEGEHRNWGLRNIEFEHSWVFVIDADERMTSELHTAMCEAIANSGSYSAFRLRRRDYFMDTWLKHVTPSPFNIRLVRPSRIRYERLTNPVAKVDGKIGDIAAHFDHFPFSKGMTHWFDKHNKYSSLEADQIFENQKTQASFSFSLALFGKDANERRFHQKELYYRLPFRPLAMFVLLYVLKRGFLDGRAGFTFAILRSIYEYMIVTKVRELQAMQSKI